MSLNDAICHGYERTLDGLFKAVRGTIKALLDIAEPMGVSPERRQEMRRAWAVVFDAWNAACNVSKDAMRDIGVEPLTGGTNKND